MPLHAAACALERVRRLVLYPAELRARGRCSSAVSATTEPREWSRHRAVGKAGIAADLFHAETVLFEPLNPFAGGSFSPGHAPPGALKRRISDAQFAD
jgi:hypothetical protein